jgi:bifunctional UDP-N-acetylglucosamine pyrophosphorylase/glucosamine-1-phosphate N-acetyltransferase
MNSGKPKVLMEVLFEPMLDWVLDAVKIAEIDNIAVIIGNEAELLEKHLAKKHPHVRIFLQPERKGTGHAVMQAKAFLEESAKSAGDALVLCGDAPFIDSATINSAYELHKSKHCAATVITANIDNPDGYGRIVRDGGKLAIVESKDCNDEQRKITEVSSGGYWFNSAALLDTLPKLTAQNKSGEYYLTDTIELLSEPPNCAGAYKTHNNKVILGANDRRGLRELNKLAAEMIIDKHLDNGVDIIGECYIAKDAVIGRDTVILPGTIIRERCVIGENCSIGPFAHLRPNCVLKNGVKIGDFVEVKNSVIGEKTSIAHLTYIGDSDVGKGVNFGCGCVTANYDGINKYRTTVGDNAFIGCNTNLIAPVKIGDNAMTAAGSTVSKDVPADSLAIERGQLAIKEEYVKNKLRKKK